MQSIARTRVSWLLLLGVALFGWTTGCGSKDPAQKAKADDPPPLAKPALELSAPAPAMPGGPDASSSKPERSSEVISGDAPEPLGKDGASADNDDDDEFSDRTHGKGKKKKHGKNKRGGSRKRSSSGPASESASDESSKDAAGEAAPLKLKRIQFAQKIASREPIDPEETFSAAQTDKLYAFVELSNESKQKSKVSVTFVPPSGGSTRVTLDVGDKARWRTWAMRKGPKAVGTWKVVVRDESGRELGHRTFEVTE